MVEVKVFEDGEVISQASADAVSVTAITDKGENIETHGILVKGKGDRETLLGSLASSCARHIVVLCNAEDEACMAMAAFMLDVKKCGVKYLKEKYRTERGTEDGKL